MEKSTIAVVHPDLDEQRSIAEALAPVRHPLAFARATKDILSILDRGRVGVVITHDVGGPFERPYVVERLQRESLRVPTVVLRQRARRAPPVSATRLLVGPVQYLLWPEEASDLAPVVRGLLRASRLLEPSAVPPGESEWIPALRNRAVIRERSDLIAALRASEGNVSRAAHLLGISRGGMQYRLRKHGIVPAQRGNPAGRFETLASEKTTGAGV